MVPPGWSCVAGHNEQAVSSKRDSRRTQQRVMVSAELPARQVMWLSQQYDNTTPRNVRRGAEDGQAGITRDQIEAWLADPPADPPQS